MNNRMLTFREVPFNPEIHKEYQDSLGVMEVTNFPDSRILENDLSSSGYEHGGISFGRAYVPYYNHANLILWVCTTPSSPAMSWHLYYIRGKDREEAYANLEKLLMDYNRKLTNNTLYPEDVFERMPL